MLTKFFDEENLRDFFDDEMHSRFDDDSSAKHRPHSLASTSIAYPPHNKEKQHNESWLEYP